MAPMHEVVLLCSCEDIEQCRMERYASDIRLLLTLYGDPLAKPPQRVLDARAVMREERSA